MTFMSLIPFLSELSSPITTALFPVIRARREPGNKATLFLIDFHTMIKPGSASVHHDTNIVLFDQLYFVHVLCPISYGFILTSALLASINTFAKLNQHTYSGLSKSFGIDYSNDCIKSS